MNEPTVVILSGGMDSAVLLATLTEEKRSIYTLTFDYGSKHNKKEGEAAEKLIGYYGVIGQFVNMSFIGELFRSDLLKSGGEIPDGHYEDASMKRTVVPFRNGIMLSVAIGYAESIGAREVFFGAHAGDHAIYPDCRHVFVGAMRDAARLGSYAHVRIGAPFIAMSKRQIAMLGRELQVPFEFTYSCYKGGEKHCGTCGTCTERREALAGFDPTEYEAR